MNRLTDIFMACAALSIAAAPMALTALAVRAFIGSPVIYKQERYGLNRKPFTIYKFRTMSDARDGEGRLMPDQDRLNRVGRFLRSSNLDELPQIFNVLKGDMSMVGPRPWDYQIEDDRRYIVRPGITGLSQISRNCRNHKNVLAQDTLYINNRSAALDFKILLMTPFKVFWRGQEANAITHRLPERKAQHS